MLVKERQNADSFLQKHSAVYVLLIAIKNKDMKKIMI